MSGTVQHIEKTNPMLRELNKGLMVRWINGDLIERANHDVRTSIVLYDADQMFVGALPAVLGPVLNEPLQDKLAAVGVSYYSNGIV